MYAGLAGLAWRAADLVEVVTGKRDNTALAVHLKTVHRAVHITASACLCACECRAVCLPFHTIHGAIKRYSHLPGRNEGSSTSCAAAMVQGPSHGDTHAAARTPTASNIDEVLVLLRSTISSKTDQPAEGVSIWFFPCPHEPPQLIIRRLLLSMYLVPTTSVE